MKHWKQVLAAFAMLTAGQGALAQEDGDVFTISEADDAAADREYEAAVRAGVAYLRANPNEVGDYIQTRDLDAITAALRDGALADYVARLDTGRFAKGAAYDVRLNPAVDVLADLGSTAQIARDDKAFRETLAGSAADLPEPFRDRALKIVRNTKLSTSQLLPALTEVYDEASASSGFYGEPETSAAAASVCTVERGTPRTITDGSTSCTPNANGLLAKWSFPMKPYLNCIRDQGRRGSCTAFALTANIEMRANMKRKQRYNLSEQFTYLRAEILTGYAKYREGLPLYMSVKRFDNLGTSFGREMAWPYNPSRNMITTVDTRGTGAMYDDVYPKACDGYSGYCTELNFQGKQDNPYMTNSPSSGYVVEFKYHYPPMNFAADNINAHGRSSIVWSGASWKTYAVQQQLPAKLRIAPVMASISVSDSYMASLPKGYLKYSSSDKTQSSGHAVLIVGYVPKGNLPEGAPAPAGKGYFIIRNSWGKWRGDCGYEYVDEAWLRHHVTSLTTLGVK